LAAYRGSGAGASGTSDMRMPSISILSAVIVSGSRSPRILLDPMLVEPSIGVHSVGRVGAEVRLQVQPPVPALHGTLRIARV
jgi:hypothetical protein